MPRNWLAISISVVSAIAVTACSEKPVETRPKVYVSFPTAIDRGCRGGKARIFDECGDQAALFDAALARAKAEGKVLLVEFGAEWCIWCHVFDAHINGESARFRYTYGSPDEPDSRETTTFEEGEWADAAAADELRDFVAANFVVAHIDIQHAPNSDAVFASTGAREHFRGGVPFVFTVDANGRFADDFDHDAAERRRDNVIDWYRGYDRTHLLKQLTAMRDAAR